jgi:hypothetical protein
MWALLYLIVLSFEMIYVKHVLNRLPMTTCSQPSLFLLFLAHTCAKTFVFYACRTTCLPVAHDYVRAPFFIFFPFL